MFISRRSVTAADRRRRSSTRRKSVADAVALQEDMVLVGVADVARDWRPRVAEDKGLRLFGAGREALEGQEGAGLKPVGDLGDLLERVDVVVDCTPKGVVVLWEDVLTVIGDELFYTYMVDNQAIVIPENIDAVRALSGRVPDARESIAMTDRSLGIRGGSWSRRSPAT